MKKHMGAKVALAAFAILSLAQSGQSQSVDSLLDKLVQKGILTQTEAEELRAEADADFTKAYQVKSGLPDWVTTLKIGGDLRARFEGFYSDHDDFKDRNRFRFRARIGAVATLFDDFEAGFRITSSERQGDFGGDPISGNQTFGNNGSFKDVFIDRAYGKWSPSWGPFALATIVGKMENPFVVSDMVFDADYSPEAVAQQLTFTVNDIHTLRLTTGLFVLDESSSDSDDPYMAGAQLRLDSKFTPMIATSIGVAGFMIDNEETALTDGADVPDIGSGNPRNGAGDLTVQFNPIYVDAGLTITLPEFPMYNGPFPIRVTGEYLNNLAEDEAQEAFGGGISLGRANKKGLWELSWRYKYVGASSWYEEFEESDFGALRDGSYDSGTNVRGHVFRASYALSDGMSLGLTYYLTDLISEAREASVDSEVGRLQVDALFRF